MAIYFSKSYVNGCSIERIYHTIEEVKEDLDSVEYQYTELDLETLETGLYDFVIFYSDQDNPIIIRRHIVG